MRLLFVHQNLPGQYRHLLGYYGLRGDVDVVGIAETRRLKENVRKPLPGVRLMGYDVPDTPGLTDDALRSTEAAVRRGKVVLRLLLKLKHEGFVPDVVYAHPGWGETLFLKDVFPRAKLIHFCEFYYHTGGQDFSFDPEFPSSAEDVLRLRARNFHHLMAVEQADLGIAPTEWQKTRFPSVYQPRIEVIHDGVDTRAIAPDDAAFLTFPHKNLTLTRGDEVITFVSRNLEPYRGFHRFMRALPAMLEARPNAHVVIVGGDDVSYGKRLAKGTYRQMYLRELGSRFDARRIHFVGKVPYSIFLHILQVSSVHVYLTYPFVLSWSMMEAMSAGCIVVGSRTPPVQEVIRDGENGILVDFFSEDELVSSVAGVLARRDEFEPMRGAARDTIVRGYDLHGVCLPRQVELIEADIAGARIDRLDERSTA